MMGKQFLSYYVGVDSSDIEDKNMAQKKRRKS